MRGGPLPRPLAHQGKKGVFAYPREKVQSRISSRLEKDPLPLLSVFIDHMQVGEVQINGGGTQALMAEDLLNGSQ